VPRITAHELATERGIVPFPESGEIGGDLNGALIRCAEVQRERERATQDPGAVDAAEEVLEA
jgi:hypothetical protein